MARRGSKCKYPKNRKMTKRKKMKKHKKGGKKSVTKNVYRVILSEEALK